LKLLVTALEPSANLHLKSLLSSVKDENIEISGIFDDELGEPIISSREFGVMGIFSIIPKILKGKRSIDTLVKIGKDFDKFLLIDSPAFNLPLAKKLKKSYPEKEIIYYILPKVWAWKEGRKESINRFVDTPISIFPFEKSYFPNSQYFGNPLLQQISYFRETVLKDGAISFLAGSRKSEIKNLMPLFRKLAERIDGEKRLVIPPHFKDFHIYGDISQFTIFRDTEEALKESRFAYICSGTATLEASIMGVPSVLLYKTNPVEYRIGKKFLKLSHVGLANIIFEKMGIEEEFHSEYLQNFDLELLLSKINSVDREKFLENSQKIRKLLSGDVHRELKRTIFKAR
jgi:lipid-A-disaccharide synthase